MITKAALKMMRDSYPEFGSVGDDLLPESVRQLEYQDMAPDQFVSTLNSKFPDPMSMGELTAPPSNIAGMTPAPTPFVAQGPPKASITAPEMGLAPPAFTAAKPEATAMPSGDPRGLLGTASDLASIVGGAAKGIGQGIAEDVTIPLSVVARAGGATRLAMQGKTEEAGDVLKSTVPDLPRTAAVVGTAALTGPIGRMAAGATEGVIARAAIEGAAFGGAYNFITSTLEGRKPTEIAKETGIGAAGGLAFGALLGKGIKTWRERIPETPAAERVTGPGSERLGFMPEDAPPAPPAPVEDVFGQHYGGEWDTPPRFPGDETPQADYNDLVKETPEPPYEAPPPTDQFGQQYTGSVETPYFPGDEPPQYAWGPPPPHPSIAGEIPPGTIADPNLPTIPAQQLDVYPQGVSKRPFDAMTAAERRADTPLNREGLTVPEQEALSSGLLARQAGKEAAFIGPKEQKMLPAPEIVPTAGEAFEKAYPNEFADLMDGKLAPAEALTKATGPGVIIEDATLQSQAQALDAHIRAKGGIPAPDPLTVPFDAGDAKASQIELFANSVEADAKKRIAKRKGRLGAGQDIILDLADHSLVIASRLLREGSSLKNLKKMHKELINAGLSEHNATKTMNKGRREAARLLEHLVKSKTRYPSVERLLQLNQEGGNYPAWYVPAWEELQRVWGKDAEMMAKIIAATSQNTPVDRNIKLAMEAYVDWKLGRPWSNPFGGHKRNLDLAAAGKEIEGKKVNPFSWNLRGDLQKVTVDTWMAKIYGFKVGKGGPTDTMTKIITEDIKKLAKETGLTPAVVQERLWMAYRIEKQGIGKADIRSPKEIFNPETVRQMGMFTPEEFNAVIRKGSNKGTK